MCRTDSDLWELNPNNSGIQWVHLVRSVSNSLSIQVNNDQNSVIILGLWTCKLSQCISLWVFYGPRRHFHPHVKTSNWQVSFFIDATKTQIYLGREMRTTVYNPTVAFPKHAKNCICSCSVLLPVLPSCLRNTCSSFIFFSESGEFLYFFFVPFCPFRILVSVYILSWWRFFCLNNKNISRSNIPMKMYIHTIYLEKKRSRRKFESCFERI